MFGYMRLDSRCPHNLRKHYKKYYCYLCRSLDKHYGITTRLLLSYDVTFFMLFCADKDMLSKVDKIPCVRNTPELSSSLSSDLGRKCAAMNLLLVSAKLDDNILDDGSTLARVIKLFFHRPIKKATKDYPDLAANINDGYAQFRNLEAANASIDELEDGFAHMMTTILTSPFGIEDSTRVNTLSAASRWLYYIDAVDDLDKDIKDGGFNPLGSYGSFANLKNNHYTEVFEHLKEIFADCGIKDSHETNDVIINRLLFYSIPETTSKILRRRAKV